MILINIISTVYEKIRERILEKKEEEKYARIKKEANSINTNTMHEWMHWLPNKKQSSQNIPTAKTREHD